MLQCILLSCAIAHRAEAQDTGPDVPVAGVEIGLRMWEFRLFH